MSELMEPEKKSTHKVEIVPFKIEKHPNADKLGLVQVFGYVCCVRLEDWPADTTIAAYLPPDSLVDVMRPEFAFLAPTAKDGWARVRPRKFRDVQSFGCLVPAPPGSKLGDDVAELLNVKHYEPPLPGENTGKLTLHMGGEVASGPNVFTVKYDVDALRRYHQLFQPGEQVIITEKLDGANSRYVYFDGKMHCGSRTEWKKEYPSYEHLTVENLVPQLIAMNQVRAISRTM
jgi:RNA ligase (TIGR02306 family)